MLSRSHSATSHHLMGSKSDPGDSSLTQHVYLWGRSTSQFTMRGWWVWVGGDSACLAASKDKSGVIFGQISSKNHINSINMSIGFVLKDGVIRRHFQDSSAIKSWPCKVDLKEIQLGVNQTQNVYITSWRSKLVNFYGWKLIDDEDLNCKIFTERLRYCICIFRYHIFVYLSRSLVFNLSHSPSTQFSFPFTFVWQNVY